MAAGGPGDLFGYLNQIPGADVGGGGGGLGGLLGGGQGGGLGGLGGLLGGQGGGLGGLGGFLGPLGSIQNILGGIGSLQGGGVGGDISGASGIAGGILGLIPGIGTIAGPALSTIGNLIGGLVGSGLPASSKPDAFSSYLQQQGGLAGDLGSIIQQAQNAAGGSSGVLSQSGAKAFNPNFEAGLLEALTGQNLGTVNPSTGKITFSSPAAGGAKQGVTMNFADAQNILQQLKMSGGAGFTPDQLNSPAAIKAIMSATQGGDVGIGQGLGAQKVGTYLPAVIKALAQAGITPGGTTTPGGQGGGGGTGGNGSTGTGGGGGGNTLTIPQLLALLGSGGLSLLGGQGGAGGTATATADPTINVINQAAKIPTQRPSISTGTSWSPMASPVWSQAATAQPLMFR